MDLYFPLVSFNLLLHLVVLKDENLSLLGLMFQFGRKLMILKYGQMCSCLQLLVIHG